MVEENKNFLIRIVTPDRTFFTGDATMVEFNTSEGEVGIYKNHIPMTLIVKPGVLTITTQEGQKKAALHAGFVEILQDSVTILAEIIEWSSEIDEMRAEAARERAERLLQEKNPDTDIPRATAALQRAIARISVIK